MVYFYRVIVFDEYADEEKEWKGFAFGSTYADALTAVINDFNEGSLCSDYLTPIGEEGCVTLDVEGAKHYIRKTITEDYEV